MKFLANVKKENDKIQVISVVCAEDSAQVSDDMIEISEELYIKIISLVLSSKTNNIFLDGNDVIVTNTEQHSESEDIPLISEYQDSELNPNVDKELVTKNSIYLASYHRNPDKIKITGISRISEKDEFDKTRYIQISEEVYEYLKNLDVNLGLGLVYTKADTDKIESIEQLILNETIEEDKSEIFKISLELEITNRFKLKINSMEKENVYLFIVANNFLISKGYYLTEENMEEKEKEILNSDNEELIKMFEQFKKSFFELKEYHVLYSKYIEFKDEMSNSQDDEESKEIYDKYLKTFKV